MSVSANEPVKEYAGNGVTVTFNAPIALSADDLVVYLFDDGVGTLQTITTHYTIGGTAPSSLTVTFVTAPAVGKTVIVARSSDYLRATDYTNTRIQPTTLNDDFDRLALIVQELLNKVSRAPRMGLTESAQSDFGGADVLADKVVGFNSGGTAYELKVVPSAVVGPTDISDALGYVPADVATPYARTDQETTFDDEVHVQTPTENDHPTTKLYVDTLIGLVPTGTILSFALRSAPSGFLALDQNVSRTTYANLFEAIVPSLGTFTVTIASPAVVTLTSHGFITGDSLYFTTTGALPTGLSINTLYYAIRINSNTFNIASSRSNARAGTSINTSGSQSGVHTCRACPFGIGDGSTTFGLPASSSAGFRGAGIPTIFTQNQPVNAGEVIDDQMQGHYHSGINGAGGTAGSLPIGAYNGVNNYQTEPQADNIRSPKSDGVNGAPRVGLETTGKAVGLWFYIKT